MTTDTPDHARGRRSARGLLPLFGCWFPVWLTASLMLAGCAQYQPPDPAPPRRPMATLVSITTPVQGDGESEMRTLGSAPAELLRKGWILMETRRPLPALHVLNRVLYSNPTPAPDVTALALYLRSRAFQYRGERDRALEDCRKARALTQRTDLAQRCDLEISRLAPQVAAAAPVEGPEPAAAGVTIIPRSRWNAAQPITRRLDPMGGIHRLTIHHSALILNRHPSNRDIATQIRAFQGNHVGENQWGDIGYHYLIDPNGGIWEGRSLRYQGAHAGGVNNEHNIGICLLGNFVPGRAGQSPTPGQIAAMEHLVEWLGRRYSISRRGVLTHRELKPATTCPGGRLQAIVEQMRRRLAMASPPRSEFAGVPAGAR